MTVPLIARADEHPQRTAILDAAGSHTFAQLLDASAAVASALLAGRADLEEARVAFLTPASLLYPAVQWGIWRAGGIAVPLCTLHPKPELEHVIDDSAAEILVAAEEMADRLRPIAEERGLTLLTAEDLLANAAASALPEVEADRRALIVYTSGTTGKPKGAVTTHANIAAQIESLVAAWGWQASDRILLVLPLHHVHGIVNVLCCALWSGAACEMHRGFEPAAVWSRLASDELTLFMAVPTIYRRLIATWDEAEEDARQSLSAGARRLRLMVSGSAALPVSVLDHWREISGHTLLERYGMTETGMILSNPLDGERRPGHVGLPLPGVEVRRVADVPSDGDDASGDHFAADSDSAEVPAEIQVRGNGVFREYWRRPEATAEAFVDGWFRTGDIAVVEDGSYRLLGRASVDIVKTGGFKVSALEIEEVLREHPAITECAVVGVPDAEWGERVAVAVELAESATGTELELADLRTWAKERLAVYKVPSRLLIVEALPRNALGKVTKPAVVRLLT